MAGKINTGRKQYKSMRGKIVDMELLRKRNELTPAIGNARVNARGDELGPGGKIVRKREDIVREYYDKNPRAAIDESGGFKNKKAVPTTSPVAIEESLTAEEQELFNNDDWVEDEDGNFVKATTTSTTTSKKK